MTFDFAEGRVFEFERAPRDLPNFFAFGAYYSIFVDVRQGLRRRRHHRKHGGDKQRSEADKELLIHDRSPPDHLSGNPAQRLGAFGVGDSEAVSPSGRNRWCRFAPERFRGGPLRPRVPHCLPCTHNPQTPRESRAVTELPTTQTRATPETCPPTITARQ